MGAHHIGALLLIRSAELHLGQKAAKAGAHLSEAVAFVRTQLNLKVLLVITTVVSLFTANLPTPLPLMSEDSGTRTYGTVLTALTVGSTAGACALMRAKPALSSVIVRSVLLGLLEAAVQIVSTLVALIGVLFLIGAITLVLQTGLLTMVQVQVQVQTRPDFRGRVLAIFLSVFRACTVTSTLMAGWLAHVGGPRALIGVEGGVLNMTAIGGVLLDPTSIQQLIPPRRRAPSSSDS